METRVASKWLAWTLAFLALGARASGGSPGPRDEGAPDSRAKQAVAPDQGGRLEPVVLQGVVLDPDGGSVEGALVVSSAGGRATTDRLGNYRLEIRVPRALETVRVTAFGGEGGNRVAKAAVQLAVGSGSARVEPLVLAASTACEPNWAPTFGVHARLGGSVRALAVYDDGGGPALFVGGEFTAAAGVGADHIVKWDGSEWSALGSGLDGVVRALTVYDDGTGPALYAGGDFHAAGGAEAFFVAQWNGSSWARLDGGTGGPVYSLTAYDLGDGPALYAGGYFPMAGGITVNHVAKWNGSTWSALGSGVGGISQPYDLRVAALIGFDDGSGPALYAGGRFRTAGSVSATNVAKWNGSDWEALGAYGITQYCSALALYDHGSGPELHAVNSHVPSYVERWNGTTWVRLGERLDWSAHALTVYDDGGGPELYVGGAFTDAGTVEVNHVARWNGSSWSALGSGLGGASHPSLYHAYALTTYDDGSGPVLYAGGRFDSAGARPADDLASWNGSTWRPTFGPGLNDSVYAATGFDDGTGPALYVGGRFTAVDGDPVNRIAKWDGGGWSALGSYGFVEVYSMTEYDLGDGPALYVGARNTVAKWDGSGWTTLGLYDVGALLGFDDGTGPALYAGGGFGVTSGPAHIAKWDGASWVDLGSGMNSTVNALAVFDDGSGPALYAGGYFNEAGGVPARHIARWDGASWSAVGSGITGDTIKVLAVFDDGTGPALYAGGPFTAAGGMPASNMAKWDGTSWSAVGSGVSYPVEALAVYSDANGPALFAGGGWPNISGAVTKWNGSSWTLLGGEMDGAVQTLALLADASGPWLYAGGDFTSAPDSGDGFLARWGPLLDTTAPVISCPPTMLVGDPIGSSPGEIVRFSVGVTDCADPAPDLACVPPSGSVFPPGTTVVTCTATDASGNESSCQFEIVVGRGARRP